MNTQHTPGPWVPIYNEAKHELEVRGPVLEGAPTGCAPIVVFKQHRSGPRKGQEQGWKDFNLQTLANAQLIAAAPSLLDTAQALVAQLNESYTAEYEAASWHNNNVPGVGQTIAYATYPVKSPLVVALEQAIQMALKIQT
ncbi:MULTISPECIES: hypothetical protein [unclassified Spirosoma]|uniref:hypothetical protein n=1 Tax=unclassified Spirosoma TaxID=2621999 RepID=UPI000968EA92|nr:MULTISPECIES: hypothetical protein [unclassified Spirosoma]MBN8821311.1 hypothetical protein [Spirosoma sp.]OJW78100.1 MAG: hypothetical protein BGO59_29210 [Spirosoma sp. 48-14]